ncbi:MAG: pentapeptide repeat-containing protein [Candidatus Magnetobacterium sp. LHC-1]
MSLYYSKFRFDQIKKYAALLWRQWGTVYRGAYLRRADLRGADFGEISISDNYIGKANLKDVKLDGAKLDQGTYERLKELRLLLWFRTFWIPAFAGMT